MTDWEYLPYRIERTDPLPVTEELNNLGRIGWEFVGVAPGGRTQWLVFKRPVPPERAEESPEERALRAIKGAYSGGAR
jgi:hypothetical protein